MDIESLVYDLQVSYLLNRNQMALTAIGKENILFFLDPILEKLPGNLTYLLLEKTLTEKEYCLELEGFIYSVLHIGEEDHWNVVVPSFQLLT